MTRPSCQQWFRGSHWEGTTSGNTAVYLIATDTHSHCQQCYAIMEYFCILIKRDTCPQKERSQTVRALFKSGHFEWSEHLVFGCWEVCSLLSIKRCSVKLHHGGGGGAIRVIRGCPRSQICPHSFPLTGGGVRERILLLLFRRGAKLFVPQCEVVISPDSCRQWRLRPLPLASRGGKPGAIATGMPLPTKTFMRKETFSHNLSQKGESRT